MSMKKFLMLSLVALFAVSGARADKPRSNAVERLETCEAILQGFQNRPETAIPSVVLQRAKALIILNQFKAGFLLGIKDGWGVIMVRKADNSWSLPVLINAGEASFGLQVGANSAETVLVITDPNVPKLLFKGGRVNLGLEAKAVGGPRAASREKVSEELLKVPILAYTKNAGLFVGATVKTGYISRDDEANFALYRTRYTLPELLYGDFVQPAPEVRYLMSYVQRLAP